jgi:uncharacterized cupredoxin-like copper-binding protein
VKVRVVTLLVPAGLLLAAGGAWAVAGRAPAAPARGAATAQTVRVDERDFSVRLRRTVVPAGDVVLETVNRGPDSHELIVVRASARALPFRRDGLTVDEEALEGRTAGSLEPAGPGTRELRLRLRPGHYVVLCNMSGHYLGGMHAELVVR